MKVYIVTECRSSSDLYDQAEDYTRIVGAFARREDAEDEAEKCVAGIMSDYADRDYVDKVADRTPCCSTVTIAYGKGEARSTVEYGVVIHEEEVRK